MPDETNVAATSDPITPVMLQTAREIAAKSDCRAILVYADTFRDDEAIRGFVQSVDDAQVILVTRSVDRCRVCEGLGALAVQVPRVRLTRMGQIQVAILLAVSRGLLDRGDRVLCLSGIAESGALDSLLVTEVGGEFELFAAEGAEEIPSHVRSEVFERVLDIAVSLGIEGREGRPVGTLFVLGDTEEVLRHSEQMILNPFRGYPEAERNLLDPLLTETIKEYATLDGAFVVREDGVVECAGRFLRSTIAGRPLPSGLGARHQSAAAVTAATSAVAIAVSESTGNVTIFEKGKILFEIQRPRPLGPEPPAQGHRRSRDQAAAEEDA
ncbi:MAG: DNA integrity scanning protein DisA nucleotide-binding domain protein [Planctomycetota bacterium]